MTVNVSIVGTVAEVKATKTLLPASKAQCTLYGPAKHEHTELHRFDFTLPFFPEKHAAIIVACAAIMPTLLYRVSDEQGASLLVEDDMQYCNYEGDPSTVILARYEAPLPSVSELIARFEEGHIETMPFATYEAMSNACHYVAQELATLKKRHYLSDYEACEVLSETLAYIINRLHVAQYDTSVEPAQNIDKRGYIQKSLVFEVAHRQLAAQLHLQKLRTAS